MYLIMQCEKWCPILPKQVIHPIIFCSFKEKLAIVLNIKIMILLLSLIGNREQVSDFRLSHGASKELEMGSQSFYFLLIVLFVLNV